MDPFVSFGDNNSLALKLFLSSLMGTAFGIERFWHGRPAGLRTHLLVCLASTLLMEISIGSIKNYPGLIMDPTRLAAGVITGIGFLGAGVILRSKEAIQGLTSAACIWMVSALGLAIGAGIYGQSIAVCIISLLALTLMKEIENRLPRDIYRVINVESSDDDDLFEKLKILADKGSVMIISDGFQRNKRDQSIKIDLGVKVKNGEKLKDYCHSLYSLDSVWRVSLER